MKIFGTVKLIQSVVINQGRNGIVFMKAKHISKNDPAQNQIGSLNSYTKSSQFTGSKHSNGQHTINSKSRPWLYAFLSVPVLAYISADDQSMPEEEKYFIKTTKSEDYQYEDPQESKVDHAIDFIILRPEDEPETAPGVIADIGSLTIGFMIGYAMEHSLNLLIWGVSAQLLVVYTIAKWGYLRVNWERLNPLLKYEIITGDKPLRNKLNDLIVKNWQLKVSMVTGFVLGMNLVNLM